MLAVVPAGADELMQVSWRAFAGLLAVIRFAGADVQVRVQVQVSILLIYSCAYCVQVCKLLVCWHLCAGDSAHCRFMELAAELPWEAGASEF